MEQDLATLQIISDTLKEDPKASQRKLAEKAGVSLGLMNSVLQRYVERGWIMLSNVNGRKLAYAVTLEGMSELAERGKRFVTRTFQLACNYNEALIDVMKKAKFSGKTKVILYGDSYIKFLIVYACKEVGLEFENIKSIPEIDSTIFYIVGEMVEKSIQESLINKGFLNLVDIL